MRLPLLRRYYEGAMTSQCPSLRTSLPSFGGSTVASLLFALARSDAASRAWTWSARWSVRDRAVQTQGSPTFLSNPVAPAPGSSTPDGFSRQAQLRRENAVPGDTTPETPINNLSGLIQPASELAVYASQGGSPHRPRKTRFRLLARLCRTGLDTRRAAMKGFRSCLPLHKHPPFSSLVAQGVCYFFISCIS